MKADSSKIGNVCTIVFGALNEWSPLELLRIAAEEFGLNRDASLAQIEEAAISLLGKDAELQFTPSEDVSAQSVDEILREYHLQRIYGNALETERLTIKWPDRKID